MTNEVRLRGRVSRGPEERELPSGDTVWVLRLVVPRPEGSRPGTDWVDCAVWRGRLRRSVAGWRPDDEVEVEGALRRRFCRGEGRPGSLVEIEVAAGRVIRRAPPA